LTKYPPVETKNQPDQIETGIDKTRRKKFQGFFTRRVAYAFGRGLMNPVFISIFVWSLALLMMFSAFS